MDEDVEDMELVAEHIEPFGITFSRPEFWDFRIEHDNTWLYWDEDAGSMRVTPLRLHVDIERYLHDIFEKESAHAPEWRTIAGRKGVAWISDGVEDTRSHFVVTGRDDLVIVCSYAYDPALYAEDDEFYGPAVDVGVEQFEEALASMRF